MRRVAKISAPVLASTFKGRGVDIAIPHNVLRVYISSNFYDFKEECNHLIEDVLPYLRYGACLPVVMRKRIL